MTQRSRLDAFPRRAGGRRRSRLPRRRQGDRARADRDGVEARPSTDENRCKSRVFGADGVNGIGARAAGLDDGRDYGVALEANVPYGVVSEERYHGLALPRARQRPRRIRLGLPEGRPRQRRRRRLGARGAAAAGAPCRASAASTGSPSRRARERARLPPASPSTRARVSRRGASRSLGDAAGLVDPLSGDGIYEALLSAKLAPARRSTCSPARRTISPATTGISGARSPPSSRRPGARRSRSTASRV